MKALQHILEILMSVWTWFRNRWQQEATHYTYFPIDAANVSGRTLFPDEIKSGEHYFKLTLAEMFLKNDREWFSAWHPVTYSLIKLKFGDSEETISHVAGPSSIKDIDQHANASISMNHTVVPVVPFNGGDIELEAGLVAVKDSDDVKQLLKVLTDVSTTLAVPQLSAAVSFAQPLVNGIETLAGSDKNKTVLRLHDTFSSGPLLRARYLAGIDAAAGTIPENELFVKNDKLCRGTSLANSQQLNGQNYVLFRIDALAQRDDWDELTVIKEPFQLAIDMLNAALGEPDPDKQKSMVEEAKRRLAFAKLAAYKSKDLTKVAGRRQVTDSLQRKFEEAKQMFGQGAAAPLEEFSLAQAMAKPMPHAEAVALGEMDESELYFSSK
jgi:hypothetical protein